MSDFEDVTDQSDTSGIEGKALFSLLGKAHMLEIISFFIKNDGPLRYGDVEDALGLSPNTLTRRLDELVEVGFLHREQYDEIPPRVEYETTEKLEALGPVYDALAVWMDQYGSEQFFSLGE